MRLSDIYYGIPLVTLLTMMPGRSSGQQDPFSTQLLKCSLLRDSLQVEESSFSFNNFNFTNTGSTPVDLEIVFQTPDFINIISGTSIKTTIEGSQNKIVPFRFEFVRKSIPVGWYAIEADIKIRQTGERIRKKFYLRPKENSNWKASLKQPSITFTSTDKEIVFNILLQNTGNSPDEYKVFFETELRLDQPKKNLTVTLAPGEKTSLPVRIILNPKETPYISRQSIDVTVRSKSGDQKLMQQFVSLIGDLYTGHVERWNKMPLYVELNMQNIASRQPFAYFNAAGSINLSNDSRLSIQYQSDHFYKTYSVNAQLARIEYQKNRLIVGAGSVVDFNNFLVDGMGGKISYSAKNETVYEITGAKGRIGQTQYYNARVNSPLSKKLYFSSNLVGYLDNTARVNSYLMLNRLDWSINPSTRLSVEAGAGRETVNKQKLDTSLNGLQYGYLFDKTGKNFQLRSNIVFYSKNFPGFNKGFQYQLHEARWFGKKIFAGAYLEKNYRSYNTSQDSSIAFLFNMRTFEYGIRTGLRLLKGSILFSPGVLKQRQDSLSAVEATMYKIGLNANLQFNEKVSLSLFSNAGRVYMDKKSADSKGFNSMTNLVTFQAYMYGFNLRYDEGPYYYYEIKQYINQPTQLKRLQFTPFLELPLRKFNMAYRLQLNYMREKPDRANFYQLYNNLQYSSYKTGLDIGVTGQWTIQGTQEPFVNFVLRKKLSIPVILNRESANMTVKLFLDKNADGKFNGSDEPVTNAMVVSGDSYLMTNSEGIIQFRNIPRKPMRLDFGHISHVRGWIPKLGYNQLLTPGSQSIQYIPFARSKVVSGKLVLLRDPKSNLSMDLEAIRLVATNNAGEVFNTLTNAAGEFFFNLPAGEFTVTVNPGAFDETFKPVETTKLADLINNEQVELQFEIRQKKRQLNLHKE